MSGLAFVALLVGVPFVLVVGTSFIKFSVVFAILRRALGGEVLPLWAVTGGLALLFALFVSAPVAEKAWNESAPRGPTPADAPAQRTHRSQRHVFRDSPRQAASQTAS